MVIHVNDNEVCRICGGYRDRFGHHCTNGHPLGKADSVITLEQFEKLKK